MAAARFAGSRRGRGSCRLIQNHIACLKHRRFHRQSRNRSVQNRLMRIVNRSGAGGVQAALLNLSFACPTSGAGIFNNTVLGAGWLHNIFALIPGVAERFGMVADEAAAAALADICGLAAGGAGWQYRVRLIIMGQSVSHSGNMSVAAN